MIFAPRCEPMKFPASVVSMTVYRRNTIAILLFCLMSSGQLNPADANEPTATGLGGASPFLGSDVVVLIDRSSLTLVSSGVDVDKDGVVGRDMRQALERNFYRESAQFWTSDSGDTLGELQLEIARALVERLALRENRVGLESFALRVRYKGDVRLTDEQEVSVPVGATGAVLAAIADFPAAGERMRTDLSRLLERAAVLLDEAVTHIEPARPQVIVLLSLGQPSAPDGIYWSSQRALKRAAELGKRGIAVWAIALRPQDIDYLEELTRLGNGGVIPYDQLDSRFPVPTS